MSEGDVKLRATFPDVLKEGAWDALTRTLRVSASLFSEMQYQHTFSPEKWRSYCDEKLLPIFGPGEVRVVVDHSKGDALVAPQTWQPIETAPQKPAGRGVRGDQESLLVWRPGLPEGISALQHLPDGEWYSCETGMPLGWKPTHWQPLPKPPEEAPE